MGIVRFVRLLYPTFAVFGSAAAAILLFLGADFLFGKFKKMDNAPIPFTVNLAHESFDDILGYKAPRGKESYQQKMHEGKVLFDIAYRVDAFDRRPTPVSARSRPRQYALFFVDSNVFGEGLAETQTIPARFAEKLPEYRAYNYAYRGYGPQQMLGRLRRGFRPGELTEKSGIAIYLYHDYHISRANGFLSTVRWAGGKHPYYELTPEGELEYRGTFAEGRWLETWILWWAGKSNLGKYFRSEWPPRTQEKHYALACAMVRESKRIFESLGPKNRFFVVLATAKGRQDRFAELCLDRYQVPYWELAPDSRRGPNIFPADGHWNATGAEYVAGQLVKFVTGNAKP